MRKEQKRIIISLLSIFLLMSMRPSTVFAQEDVPSDQILFEEISEENFEAINPINSNEEFKLSDSDEAINYAIKDKNLIKEKLDHATASEIQDAMKEEINRDDPEPEDPDPVIYYGSMTGYLTETNDFALYPASLSAGQYLQTRLTLPNDPDIDYDLWLLDSSFSTIKTSDYYTVTTSTMTQTLQESIGYIASSNETIYVCVYSVGGGSTTDAYTLDYVIGEDNYDSGEPDENTKELTTITFTDLHYSTSRTICSPLDNDWYSFSVIDDPTYNKMRFTINSSSAVNGCHFEIYDNVVSGGYGMRKLADGTDGEMPLDPGTYYIRVISDNNFSTYDPTDIPTYTLSVLPVSRVDGIEIYNYLNEHYVTYNQGSHHRVEMNQNNVPNHTGIRGRAFYSDPSGLTHPSINAKITCTIVNESWMAQNQPGYATTQNSSLTNSSGVFGMYVDLNPGIGTNTYAGPMSWHKYDLMDLSLTYDNIIEEDNFYYLIRSIPY